MNIILIGHEGYLGSGMYSYLSRKHKVFGWDRKENMFSLDAAYLAQNQIEMVINMSVALDRHGKNFQVGSPSDEVNVGGARHLAKILKGTEIAWIQMSTREVLGPIYRRDDVVDTPAGFRGKFLIHEEYPYAPLNSYGKSKVMSEFISESHPNSNVIRLTTCYTDHGNSPGSWVVNLIKAVVKGQPVSLTQGGLQFRDPLHVDDLARLIELLHVKKVRGEKIHAGGGANNLISLREFVEIAQPGTEIKTADGGDFGFAFDIAKAHRLTGWNPQVLIREKIPVIAQNIRRELEASAAP